MPEKKKILVVDDDPDALVFAEAMLSEIEGVSVDTAGDGGAGLAKVSAAPPDLIILDVQMPERDGFSVFSELRQKEATANIPVIMLTGVAAQAGIGFSAREMKEFIGAEPAAYLEKPVEPEKLQAAARQALGL